MRGFGSWLNRDRVYVVTDTTDPTLNETFTVVGPPLLGPDWGNESSYRGGMGIPAAWRAARLVAGLIGSLPWHAYREGGSGQPLVKVDPTPMLLDQPSPPDTRVDTFTALAMDYLWHGTACALLGPVDSRGNVTSMLPISAERVWGGYIKGRPEYTVDAKPIERHRLLVIKAPAAPGAVKGLGILENHFKSVDLSRAQARGADVANAGVPTGILQINDPDVEPAELKAAKADWLLSQYNRTIAALPPGVTFQPIAWNPSEMQMIEARKFDLQTWELIFGLPVGYLGGEGPSMHYSNMAQEDLRLLKMTLSDPLIRFEQALSQLFMSRRVWVKANVDAVLRPDTAARYAAHAVGLAAGFLTADEARALENLAPLPAVAAPSPEVAQALQLATAAPSLVQNPGLPALVDQLRALNGLPALSPTMDPEDEAQEGTE